MVVHNYSSCNDSYNLKHALKKQDQSIYEKYKDLNLIYMIKNLEVFYSVLYSLNEDNYSEILK